MSFFKTLAAGLLFTSAALSGATAQQEPAQIPVEVFAALPKFEQPKLSPSGTKLGYFVEVEGRRNLYVYNLDGSGKAIIPPGEKQDFENFYWKTDDVLLAEMGFTDMRKTITRRVSETRVWSLNLQNQEMHWLGKPDIPSPLPTSQFEEIVDLLPDDPDHILLSLVPDTGQYYTVYKTNVHTSSRSTIQTGRRGINDWYADQSGDVRMGTGFEPRSAIWNMIYKTAEGEWIDLDELAWTNDYTVRGFTSNPEQVYVSGKTPEGTDGIFTLDVRSGKILETVFTLPEHDAEFIYNHPVTRRVAGVSFVDDYWRLHYFDKDMQEVQALIDATLPGTVNAIESRAANKELYLISSRSDRNPGYYFLFDRDSKELQFLIKMRPDIDGNIMASTIPLEIPVRDGSKIPAYMTVPHAVAPQMLPTIIMPHGGPQARDDAEWDYEAQFYASRGYLVVKPNFRGSTGYGRSFEKAGLHQWGGLMQDDVTDTTKWLIEQGMADPKRICIVGASYGGYAALMGAIREPDLYACAVSVNGVTNLPQLKLRDKGTIGGRAWIKNMGLEGKDDKQVSPYHMAEAIKAPVLLIAARDDARINYNMSKDMHKRLKGMNKSSQYVELEAGTHHMVRTDARLTQLKAIEAFLAEHIGK